MMKGKSFDCVQMKHDIQRKLSKEYKGLSVDQVDARRTKKIAENPVLRKFIRGTGSSAKKQVDQLVVQQD